VTVTTPTFGEILVRVMLGLSPRTRLPNLKFVPSAVLELLAFNAPKFTGSRDRDHAHFWGNICQAHVGTIPENTPAKFEVPTFSRFGTDIQTDRQTGTGLSDTTAWLMVIAGDWRPDTVHRTPDTIFK